MPWDSESLLIDKNGKPVPQTLNPVTGKPEPVLGRNGAQRVELYGPDGQPISTLAVDVSDKPARQLGTVTLSGSLPSFANDLRGLAANKPAANSVAIGTTYWSVDTDPHGEAIEVSDGTRWVVI